VTDTFYHNMRSCEANSQIKMSKANLESKLRKIAELIGEYIVFKIGVNNTGKISIIGLETEYDEEDDDDEEELVYPILKKPNIRKPLVNLDYIG